MAFTFIFLMPVLLAIIGAIIALLFFIGICLLLIGITGSIMNKIYLKQAEANHMVSKPLYNTASVILGTVLILFPLGFVLYTIISAVMK